VIAIESAAQPDEESSALLIDRMIPRDVLCVQKPSREQ
jgi:hypothetical protein